MTSNPPLKKIAVVFVILVGIVYLFPSVSVYENPNADRYFSQNGTPYENLPCYEDSTQNYWTRLCSTDEYRKQNEIRITDL